MGLLADLFYTSHHTHHVYCTGTVTAAVAADRRPQFAIATTSREEYRMRVCAKIKGRNPLPWEAGLGRAICFMRWSADVLVYWEQSGNKYKQSVGKGT